MDAFAIVQGHAYRKSAKLLLFILLLTALLTSGCAGAESVSEARMGALQKDAGEILIGAAWPFNTRNELFREGAMMAAEEVNAAGGVLGRRINLVLEDDLSSVTLGMTIAQKFADNPQIAAVIGHRTSSVSLPTSAIYENAGLLMLSPGSTSPKLTANGYDLVFRSIPSDEQIGKEMALYASWEGYRKIAVYYANNEYGRGLANTFEDFAEKLGISIIDRVSNYSDSRELDAIVRRWELLDYDALFVVDTMPSAAQFIVGARKSGVKVPIFGGDGLDSDDLWNIAGNDAEGIVVASIFDPTSQDNKVQRFVASFHGLYGKEPNKWAAQGYDSVHLLAAAIQKAGTSVPQAVAQSLRSMNDWAGVTGLHHFDEQGDIQGKKIVLKTVKNGRFEYLN